MTTTEKRIEYWLDKPDRFWIATHDGYMEVSGQPVGFAAMPEADLFVNQSETTFLINATLLTVAVTLIFFRISLDLIK